MTSIAFTGDIAFSKYFAKGHEKPDLFDREITDFLCSADHVVANIEAPLRRATSRASASSIT